jgi:alkyl hydroperoxide reductase subunit AhpC
MGLTHVFRYTYGVHTFVVHVSLLVLERKIERFKARLRTVFGITSDSTIITLRWRKREEMNKKTNK